MKKEFYGINDWSIEQGYFVYLPDDKILIRFVWDNGNNFWEEDYEAGYKDGIMIDVLEDVTREMLQSFINKKFYDLPDFNDGGGLMTLFEEVPEKYKTPKDAVSDVVDFI